MEGDVRGDPGPAGVNRPTRDTPGGGAYLQLRRLAREQGRGTDELLVLYVLERFLYRLAHSVHRDRLVLKGGMLLAALDQRRPTRDVDLLAVALSNDIDAVTDVIRSVLAVEVEDGVAYDLDRMTASIIREQGMYSGVRVAVPATIASAQVMLKVDVNVGDPVTPGPVELDYPALLDDPFRLVGYPIETVLAEKLVTMIERAATTTRDRDFADVWTLTRRHAISAQILAAAIAATAGHRGVKLQPLEQLLAPLAQLREAAWAAFVARAGLASDVPNDLADVISDVVAFADPLLAGDVTDGEWDQARRRWMP